ncbi:MAG TPA: sigma-70 family RNA polymerase sigma factor [Acidimicrobiales bacterium]|nr:sigma-70 family RNA polymerase sigma factor [Acidimicrobiales bacterium]
MTASDRSTGLEDLLRELAPQVLGVLVRRYGQFDRCEDAVQEALLAASRQWPEEGRPASPRAWLITVARRRLTDQLRSEHARQRREDTAAHLAAPDTHLAAAPDDDATAAALAAAGHDDTLTLLFLCCHPALSPASQLALTLRAVGGLTTAEIARAFLVPEATMAQRISRAKQSIKAAGSEFAPPPEAERAERLRVVLHVLYLVFNEGYTTSSGPDLARADLTTEAIRLTRAVHRLLPDDGEVTGLLALMVLTDARRPARTGADGALVPLAEQDRTLWDRAAIAEGIALVSDVLPRARLGPYQLQAAIAAVHAEGASAEATDWGQIVMLYELLDRIAPNPMVTLNKAVALAMVHGPRAGLDTLAPLDADARTAGHHRLAAVRGHLLEMAGDEAGARDSYRRAARATTSLPEQRYLDARAARLA